MIFMSTKSLQQFINILETEGELIRIKDYVDPVLEIAEIADRFIKQGEKSKALLFENNGTHYPLLINYLGSEKRMNLIFGGQDLDQLSCEIGDWMKNFSSPKEKFLSKLKFLPSLSKLGSWMPATIKGKGHCQEIIDPVPDLFSLPALKCWPADGGRFITLPMVITRDAETGVRNVGMYRMQIFDKAMTGMHWHLHKTGARHYAQYKKLGKKMPVAVALGGDPVLTYCATAPMPDNMDEFLLAGFLRKKKVKLVKCITQNIEVPEEADIVIEGYVDPEEELIWEGPFGDHTGFYSLADWYPKFHVTCITHRRDAVFPATLVGIPPQEDAWIARATEKIFFNPIKMFLIPEILNLHCPTAGVAHNLTIVKVKKSYPGQVAKVMNALWGAGQMMLNKILVVVDETTNVEDYRHIAQLICQRVDFKSDIYFSSGPLDVLDHTAREFALGSKMCIDATSQPQRKSRENKTADNETVINIPAILKNFPDIEKINSKLLEENIPVILIAIRKNKMDAVKSAAESLLKLPEMGKICCLILFDYMVDTNDIFSSMWLCLSNIDPERDCSVMETAGTQHLVVDATRKTGKFDQFKRQWPNITVSDDATIKKVDEKWENLGLGEFIVSPSSKYKILKINEGAVVNE